MAATDDNTKDTLLNDIIYHWAGVQDMDPVGRNPSQVYGNVLGDARKLEALEEFMGEDYLGTWCWGERETNPHGHAAPMILQAFELLKNYVGTILSADMANNPYLQKIILTYNAETKHWDVNVDQAVALLQEAFEADATNGKIEMLQLSNILRFYDNAEDVIAAFQAKGSADGTFFETELLNFGHNSVGSAANDNLFGTEGNDLMNGLAGNDIIKAAEGDDTALGGSGNDYIYGEDGDDVLDGEEGNDYLFGGNGNDTLKGGAGDDVLSGGNGADIYLFEKGLVHEQEDQGIIIQNFFSGQDYKIEKINFFDGSSVNLSEIGLTLKQLKTGESIKGTEFDDIIYANGGNDTVNAGIGDDTIYGEAGFDTLYGEDGNDVLIGGTGNDRLEGGLGDDTYIYNVGDGLDTIYDDNRGNTDNDTIKFGEGISFSDITFSRKDNNLIMTLFNDITQGVIIQNFFSSSYYQVEKLEFADGTTVPLTERGFEFIQNDGADNVSGTNYDDTIYGKGGNDTIYGYSGNDTLIGGKGNDRLEGSYGDDTYIWNLGDGFDTIYDYNGGNTDNDTIKFGEGISFEDLSFERDGNSLSLARIYNSIASCFGLMSLTFSFRCGNLGSPMLNSRLI